MKNIYVFIAVAIMAILLGTYKKVFAQLPDGNLALNWTLVDINSNTYSLFDYTNQGKKVIIDFSAVWCSPCWQYHNSGALEDIYNQYGPSVQPINL